MAVLVRRVCDNAASRDARRKRKLAREMGRRERDKLKKEEREGSNLPSFLTVSSRFGGYPRCPHRATPYGPANLVRDDWRRANPLIPFHLPIARQRERKRERRPGRRGPAPVARVCSAGFIIYRIVRVTQFNSLIYFPF